MVVQNVLGFYYYEGVNLILGQFFDCIDNFVNGIGVGGVRIMLLQ